MTTYNGPATLLFGDDEYPVHAQLRSGMSGRLTTWSGSITAQPDKPADMWAVTHAGSNARLRLPDGSEGEFMPSSSNMMSNPDVLQIKGSGPTPF
jgi:hypothetical protein